MIFENTQLYNCCDNSAAPNWAEYEFLTLEGCVEHLSEQDVPGDSQVTEVLGGQDREDAQFFTIYGWNQGSRAITKLGELDQATSVLKHLSEISGLEYWINC